MATRFERLSRDHVIALNMIDVDFYGNKPRNKAILDAWHIYLDHLTNSPATTAGWAEKGMGLLADLLHLMGIFLGYEFDKVHLQRACYSPVAQADLEKDQDAIRKGVVKLLSDQYVLPVKVLTTAEAAISKK